MPSDTFTLGLDLDGVVADYIHGLRPVVARQLGVPTETLSKEVGWGLSEWGLTGDQWEEYDEIAMSEGAYRHLPVLPDAIEALHELRSEGVFIRIVTQRHSRSGSHHKILKETLDWLHIHRVPYDDFLQIRNKADVSCDIHVEDAPHQIEAIQKTGRPVIIFDQPWNRELVGMRAHGWTEAGTMILRESLR